MKTKFYMFSTIILSILLLLIIFLRTPLVFSLETNSNIESAVDLFKKLEITSDKNIQVVLSKLDNKKDEDGNVEFEFEVQSQNLIKECRLYHNVNQPFGPDAHQINTFVQLGSPLTFTLHDVPNGEYKWGVVCFDEFDRNNIVEEKTFRVEKLLPLSSDIPDTTMKEDSVESLDLDQYFDDPKGGELKYLVLEQPENIKVSIDKGIALIEPQKNWFGTESLVIKAIDEYGFEVESDPIEIIVTEEGDTPPRIVSQIPLGIDKDELSDDDGYLSLECDVTDDLGLSEVSLYSDISGEWKIEQTKSLDGLDNKAIFELKDLKEGSYNWACSSKDITGQETVGDKQNIGVQFKIYLETELPQFIVNNVDTQRRIAVIFSSHLKDKIKLGNLKILKSNGEIYYEKDFSNVKSFDINNAKFPEKTVFMDDIILQPDKLFNDGFYVGNKVDLHIILNYNFENLENTEKIEHRIEITKRPRGVVNEE